ncbi:MAG TPA: hypothetical protein DCZ41_05145 [Firmicutes bacterium]|nr:hypothetical protein [Bacillota bacterium]
MSSQPTCNVERVKTPLSSLRLLKLLASHNCDGLLTMPLWNNAINVEYQHFKPSGRWQEFYVTT